ncbi:MAG: RNA methyltransferase [Gemmatimonas sp.]
MPAGTKNARRAAPATPGPAIVLVRPQLGVNIGSAARAMLNCGLADMRLVGPREGWPNDHARASASGADVVLERARVFATVADAIADLHTVYATTARGRDMMKPVLTPRAAAEKIRGEEASGVRVGILFGPERTGLENDDIAVAASAIAVPLNPSYSSLNLAQAVLLIGYEWYQANPVERPAIPEWTENEPATGQSLTSLYEHLEAELDRAGFLYPPEKRPGMVISIRNIFARAGLTEQEVRTLRGIIKALVEPRARGEAADQRPLGRKPRG